MNWSLIALGTGGAAAAGMATTIGASTVFLIRDLPEKLQNMLLSFAAGVMLAASFFSLILPGLMAFEGQGHRPVVAAISMASALLLGAGALHLINAKAPHEHFVRGGQSGADHSRLARIWLFVIAITIHNVPEGLAVGVSFGGADPHSGWATALGIGTQNIPEGMAVAVSLVSVGYRRTVAFVVAMLSGMVEPIAGFCGIVAVSSASVLLPWGLGFAAGAMIWVVSSEIIPETHRNRSEAAATASLMVGFALMLFLDWSLR